jgi:CRISPR/Cas system-associated endonuclease Cas1
LDKKAFELALDLLEEWRFDRHVVERRLQKYLDQKDDES